MKQETLEKINEVFKCDEGRELTELICKVMTDIFGNVVKEIESKNDTDELSSYVNVKDCFYENGKCIKKREKEIVNGECVKDVVISADTAEGKDKKCFCGGKHCSKKCNDKLSEEDEKLSEVNVVLKKQIAEMTEYIDGLNDKIKELTIKNAELQSIVDNVKKCF